MTTDPTLTSPVTPEPLRRTRWRQWVPRAARTRIIDAVHHTGDGDRIGLGSRLDDGELLVLESTVGRGTTASVLVRARLVGPRPDAVLDPQDTVGEAEDTPAVEPGALPAGTPGGPW